jgi:Major Facilitator Superfamily.
MRKILTQQPKVSWLAVTVILLPWMCYEVHNQLSKSAMVFSLRKFTNDPALIGFITSLNFACGLLTGSIGSLVSDRIWTRYGRRRPFLVIGFLSAGVISLFLPHISFLWGFAASVLVYQLAFHLVHPYEPLTMEVVPPAQRGRAGAIRQWIQSGFFIFFFYVLIGQFDRTYALPGGFTFTGETLIYVINALILIGAAALLWWCVEEVKPPGAEALRLREVQIWSLLKGLLSRELLPLFGLGYVVMNLWVGLEQFEPLLVTDQWGYSKAEYGEIMSYGMLIALMVVPLGGWASDKFDRLVLLKIGLAVVLGLKVFFYIYAEYIAPNALPPFHMVILLGLIRGAVAKIMIVAAVPLLFDYVSTNRLGTLSCGLAIVFGLVNFVQANSMGLWISFSSGWLYGLPEGRYNYMAAYHYLFIMGLVGMGYLYLFAHWEKTGFVKRRPKAVASAPAKSETDSAEQVEAE